MAVADAPIDWLGAALGWEDAGVASGPRWAHLVNPTETYFTLGLAFTSCA